MDIDTIATLACSIKKPNKVEAFHIVCNMIDRSPTVEDLADLYAFFLPRPTARPKTDQDWIMKALAGKSDIRQNLRFAWSDGKRLVATDGHRLHVHTGIEWPEGYYDPAGNLVSLDLAQYPNIDRVIPSEGKSFSMRASEITALPVKAIPHSGAVDGAAVKIGEASLDRRYILDAISKFDFDDIEVLTNGDNRPVKMTQGKLTAVIMPMRV